MVKFRNVVIFVFIVLLASCGEDGDGNPNPIPTATPSQTPAQRIAGLEQAGTLPILNRAVGMLPNDTNSNGVRDDIDAYIAAKSYTAPGKQALTQYARGLQSSLSVNIGDTAATAAVSLAITRATHCVFSRASSATDPLPDEIPRLESITTNTRERLTAYMQYNKALDGSVSAIPAGDTCE